VPTYEYACTNPEGKHQFEVVQSFSDAPVTECPECGVPVRKVYGSVGVVFKGSGFYRTDSRKSIRRRLRGHGELVVVVVEGELGLLDHLLLACCARAVDVRRRFQGRQLTTGAGRTCPVRPQARLTSTT
jgi:putative FmdB family regulatory protein